MHSDPLELINKIVKEHGKRGLVFLFIFYTIREKALQQLKSKNQDFEMSELNRKCLIESKKILNRIGDNPTEKEIRNSIKKLTMELNVKERCGYTRARSGYGIITGKRIKAKVPTRVGV